MNATNTQEQKLLIVEDNLDLARLLMWELEDEGFCCDHALNGREALKIFSPDKYKCILTDLFMPDMDGIHLIKAIRENCKGIPIIVLSAMKNQQSEALLEPYDIVRFYQKPLDRKDQNCLYETIKQL